MRRIFCQPSPFADGETEAGGEMLRLLTQPVFPLRSAPEQFLSHFEKTSQRPFFAPRSAPLGLLSLLLALGEDHRAILASQCFQTGTFYFISTSLLRRYVGPCLLELGAKSWEVGTRRERPNRAASEPRWQGPPRLGGFVC